MGNCTGMCAGGPTDSANGNKGTVEGNMKSDLSSGGDSQKQGSQGQIINKSIVEKEYLKSKLVGELGNE